MFNREDQRVYRLLNRGEMTVSKYALSLLGALALNAAVFSSLFAQQSNPGVQQSGAVVSGHVTTWGPGVGQVQDGGALPVGTVNSVALSSSGTITVGGTTPCTGPSCPFTVNLPALVTGATIGSATVSPVITFDNFGRATTITTATIAPPFTAITGSLACGQMPALSGDTTSSAGSCANVNVKLNGVAFSSVPATDTTPVITAANTATYTALPNCTTGALQYTTATHLFSCGAAGSGTVTSATVTAGSGMGAFTGTCTSTTVLNCTVVGSAAQLPGTATNDNASAGNIGELLSTTLPSGTPVNLPSGTNTNVTSVSLTAGDWDVRGTICYTQTASTPSAIVGGISTTSATMPTAPDESFFQFFATFTANAGQCLPNGTKRVSLAGTTTVFLVALENFTGTSAAAYGKISARRVR